MRYRRLDSSWDYCFGRGVKDYMTGVEAVAQAIKSRLLLLYGEWWEDTTDGLPLFQRILGVPGTPDNKEAIDLIVRDRISGTTGVVSILGYDSNFEKRKYTFKATVETLYGTLMFTNGEATK
jgi:hypothetical protein